MSEHESQGDAEGEDRDVESAAPSDESKVVGDGADVPAGQGEEADEGGEGSSEASGGTDAHGDDDRGDDDQPDDRHELAQEIESDPASNPEDPMLKEIKGG
jgi:hypothetical protein